MITVEQLVEYGFKKNDGDAASIFPYEKGIDEDLHLCVTLLRNDPEFCIQTPDGILYLHVKSLDELKIVESSIAGYEEN